MGRRGDGVREGGGEREVGEKDREKGMVRDKGGEREGEREGERKR